MLEEGPNYAIYNKSKSRFCIYKDLLFSYRSSTYHEELVKQGGAHLQAHDEGLPLNIRKAQVEVADVALWALQICRAVEDHLVQLLADAVVQLLGQPGYVLPAKFRSRLFLVLSLKQSEDSNFKFQISNFRNIEESDAGVATEMPASPEAEGSETVYRRALVDDVQPAARLLRCSWQIGTAKPLVC